MSYEHSVLRSNTSPEVGAALHVRIRMFLHGKAIDTVLELGCASTVILLIQFYINNGIIFLLLNYAKILDSIPDENSHKVVRQTSQACHR